MYYPNISDGNGTIAITQTIRKIFLFFRFVSERLRLWAM